MNDAELQRLLTPRPRFATSFSRGMLAACLWDQGEDDLAERALTLSDDELRQVQTIAGHLESPAYPLPLTGQHVSHRHVMAFAAVVFFERDLRPLARTRRRPERDRPERFAPTPPDPATGL